MRCSSCGHEVPDEPFCERCGKSLRPRGNGILWAIPAIVLYAAIADAAVETFLGQSPLRWWIAGAAALYFVLCGATLSLLPGIRRRMDFATQAAVSLAVLLI